MQVGERSTFQLFYGPAMQGEAIVPCTGEESMDCSEDDEKGGRKLILLEIAFFCDILNSAIS